MHAFHSRGMSPRSPSPSRSSSSASSAHSADHMSLHHVVLQSKQQKLSHQHERLSKQRAFIRHERRKLLLKNALLESERERFEASKTSDWFCANAFEGSTERRVTLDVGGQIFEVSSRLASKDPGSLLAALASSDSPLNETQPGCFRIHRDWWLFRYILQFLRDGVLPQDACLLRQLYLESKFWKLGSLQQAIESKNLELLQSASDSTDPKQVWLQDAPTWWGTRKSDPPLKATSESTEEVEDWWTGTKYKGVDYSLSVDQTS